MCHIESRDELPSPDILKIKIIEEWEASKRKIVTENQVAFIA